MSATTAGRPRDPEVDRRVLRAAVTRYADHGWAAFSVDAVARLACVGKAAIYLRWPTKEALLGAALADGVPLVLDTDTGTLRGDLLALARQLLVHHLGAEGQALRRLGVEYLTIPDVAEAWETHRRSRLEAARAMIRRGIERGEIRRDTSPTLLLDALCGGVMIHTTSTPDARRGDIDVDGYAERLVTFLLRAVE
ncbi:TetR/AcrR family transcriptional regulator [Pseudonocardia sp. WMMC193]|uniref:TetR/AcrR family transcriptional regulator n=1 Tax=Pseudonocardia sp. WMMC193 TaxID=2911965 RepID=UPI001F3442EB|nr:TetR/AcrR family transcriptional regulator [Pseudonocardia sp. WMMC193]MCF7549877.1 TetR/AcrR family transcriptional regulator [Pseudonocardia sp. WMMC193]